MQDLTKTSKHPPFSKLTEQVKKALVNPLTQAMSYQIGCPLIDPPTAACQAKRCLDPMVFHA
jgi:hypothetical protein